MDTILIIIISALAGITAGVLVSISLIRKSIISKNERLILDAEEKGEMIKKDKILQAKEKFLQLKSDHEKIINEKNSKVLQAENRIKQKETALNQKLEETQRKQKEVQVMRDTLTSQVEIVTKKQTDLEVAHKEAIDQLEAISGLSAAEAKQQIVESLKEEARDDAMNSVREIIEEAKLSANTEAKKIVIETIQRTAAEHAIENTVTVFNIENDEIKGRIIGREGRNIRTLEALTGVEIIIDDSPDAIILSGFDPVRREVARLSLHRLVTDGRIHPARIEEVVAKVKKQVELEIIETGKRTCIDLGIHNMHP